MYTNIYRKHIYNVQGMCPIYTRNILIDHITIGLYMNH